MLMNGQVKVEWEGVKKLLYKIFYQEGMWILSCVIGTVFKNFAIISGDMRLSKDSGEIVNVYIF